MFRFTPEIMKMTDYLKNNPYATGPTNNFEVYDGKYWPVFPPADEIQEFDQYNGKDWEVVPQYPKDMSYDPTASLDERTKALKYKELDKYRNESGLLPLGIIPKAGYNTYYDNQFVPNMNLNFKIASGIEDKLSPMETEAYRFISPTLDFIAGIGPGKKKRVGDAGDEDEGGDYGNGNYAGGEGDYSNRDPNTKNNLADQYYLGNSLLNSSVLINNMVQPEPPSIQAKIPHFERLRLNPEPYDNMRSQIRDQGTQAYRLQRENISQASDLMKGLAAVTSGTQQGLMNIGMQQAGAEQQIQNANQQISTQEQSMQTDVLNNEAVTNWKIQDEFYKTKGQAISSALAAMSQTGGQYAKYKTMQEMVNKQDAINKSAAEVNNQMQASLLEYQLAESALESQEYKDYYKSQRSAEQERINKELLGDEKYKSFNDYYNGVIPSYSSYQYNIDSPESQEKLRTINVAKRFQSEYPLGAAPDETKFPNDPDGYKAAVAQYNKYKEYNDKYNNDPRYKAYEAEQAFWKEALEKFNESTLKKSTAETYLKSRNLRTQSEIFNKLKSISERGAQSFE